MVASYFGPQGHFHVSLLKGVKVQLRVIGALVLRELHTRYGRSNIGYLWLIGEPLMLASVISLLHMGSDAHSGGISPMAFTLSGYCLFCVFRGIFTRAEGAIEANQSLLHHHVVTIADIVVARAVIDAVGAALAFAILFSLVCVVGLAEPPERPLHLIAGFLFMFWWSLALAFIAVAVTYEKHTLGRMMHVLSYFSIPISGAFISLSLMPPVVRQYLMYFPMALIFEQARYGTFRTATDKWVSPGYVAFWCLVLTYIGLLLMRRLRRRVAVR
ncbi:ABC transporter permease [Sphingomonas sp. R86521]|uniref:ABC transporter permease n=1 Tax=Sphingomonas sp. R86521 TaxID=3093860 RepID=UPI0036D31289